MPELQYPAVLPGPSAWATAGPDRRAGSSLPGNSAQRARWRDRVRDVDAQWIYTAEEMAVWVAWFDETLLKGQRLFTASVPGDGGLQDRALRYRVSSVRREALARGNYRVSARLQERGLSAAPNALRARFLGWWEFDENAGDTKFSDSTGRGNHVYVAGAASTSAVSNPSAVDGRSARLAASLSSVRALLDPAADKVFDLRFGGFAVGGFLRQTAAGNPAYTQRLAGRSFSDSPVFEAVWYLARATAAQTYSAAVFSADGQTPLCSVSGAVADVTAWNFVVMARDTVDEQLKLWLNAGVPSTAALLNGAPLFDGDSNFTFGCPVRRSSGSVDPTPAAVGGVNLLFDRWFALRGRLTQDDIEWIYNEGTGRAWAEV